MDGVGNRYQRGCAGMAHIAHPVKAVNGGH